MVFPLWLLLAILSEVFWTASSFFDKYILNSLNIKPIVFTNIANFSSIIPAIIVLLIFDINFDNKEIILSGIALGFLIGIVTFFYAKILNEFDTPIIAVLFQLTPIFVLLIELVIFNTHFDTFTYLGIFLTLTGGILITLFGSNFKKNIVLNISLLFLAFSCCLTWSISVSFQDFLITKTSLLNIFFLIKIGEVIFAGTTLINENIRTSVLTTNKRLLIKAFNLNILSETFNTFATLTFIYALSLGSMTLVTTVASAQPIIAIFLVLIINKLIPGIIPDKESSHNLTFKIFCMLLVVSGIYFIS